MKAKEAKELAVSKAPSIDVVLNNIKSEAEAGYFSTQEVFLCLDTMTKLMELGYTIGKDDDEGYIISWD